MNSVKWLWNEEHQQAFERVKEKLTHAPVLACPDFAHAIFTLQTDASNYGLEAILTQQSGKAVLDESLCLPN